MEMLTPLASATSRSVTVRRASVVSMVPLSFRCLMTSLGGARTGAAWPTPQLPIDSVLQLTQN
ncbi:hypothetical protein NCCP1664_24540 [Zafaria cholistanensis]|uniref:Uncharacterized protein n=1 Tax=Zafaria cholistanensis TaxID=1682741 RepID=A0A5A7NT97_9MICC|nr:hypothetical protein NCCP1664_24540 [Zafaria cholistanensis]